MKKSFGRAYIAGLSVVAGMTVIAVTAIINSPTNGEWVLTWYGDVMKWIFPALIGAKGLEKIGVLFGKANIAKHEAKSQ